MGHPIQLPPNLSDEALGVWQTVAESLTSGDVEMLQTAIRSFITLSPTDKQTLEDIAAMLPYPGLPPLLITQIFSNPEATMGIIDRLGPTDSSEEFITQLGTAEQAIVLDALISWAKSEQQISDTSRQGSRSQDSRVHDNKLQADKLQESKSQDNKSQTSKAADTKTNPLNHALQNYLASGGVLPLNMGSLQFLKSNAFTLAGLQIADPELLNQAYNMASQQLLIGLLPSINTVTSQTLPQTEGSEQSRSNLIQHQLVSAIKKALQDGAIPLNMQTFLVLWTAISLPAVQGTEVATNMANQANRTPQATGTSTSQGIDPSLPASPIVASILASLPAAFAAQGAKVPQVLINELGMLSYIYTQMAPYWSGPAAVSLMAAQGGKMTEEKKTDSAVRAFAIALGALLNDPDFDQLLTVIIKSPASQSTAPQISEEQVKIFISAMKISLLTNALIALYIVMLRKTQGQFSADELAQMILGTGLDTQQGDDDDDLETGVIKSIQAELLNIPEENREAFINNLLSAYSGSTDINALIDPSKQFLNLCDPTILLSRTLTSRG